MNMQVRRVDELGRVVLPIEGRNMIGVAEFDAVEISYTEKAITIKKHEGDEKHCITCGSTENLIALNRNVDICTDCILKRAEEIKTD